MKRVTDLAEETTMLRYPSVNKAGGFNPSLLPRRRMQNKRVCCVIVLDGIHRATHNNSSSGLQNLKGTVLITVPFFQITLCGEIRQ